MSVGPATVSTGVDAKRPERPPAPGTLAGIGPGMALGGWAALVAAGLLAGLVLNGWGRHIALDAPPLVGDFAVRLGPAVLLPLAVATTGIVWGTGLARRLRWRRLLVIAWVAAVAWAVSLALVDGPDGLTAPLGNPNEYLHDVAAVGSPGDFLAGFTDRIDGYGTHVRAHPPGLVLLLSLLDRVGLGGAGPAAALMIAAGGAMVPAALIGLRDVAGERRARAAAPFIVLAPAAIWVATSADALFGGIGALAAALAILATSRGGRIGDLLAVGSGVAFGLAINLTYGIVLLAVVPAAVAAARRTARPLILALLATGAVVLTFWVAGFWWVEGLLATRREYLESVARSRPYGYFLLINVAALAVALGPSLAVALSRLRDRATWLLVSAGLGAVAVANVSGLSKGEVERIWLPFVPWLLLACTSFELPKDRRWLAMNAGFAVLVQVGVHTAW